MNHPSLSSDDKNQMQKKKKERQIALQINILNYLVKELTQGLVAFALVADLRGRHPAGAGVDVSRAVFLTCVIQVAGLGRAQTVVLL